MPELHVRRKAGNVQGAMASTGRSRRPLTAVLFLAAVLSGPLIAARAGQGTAADPHAHFRMPRYCPRCHVYVGEKLAPDRFVVAADDFCLKCHLGDSLGRSHRRRVHPGEGLRTVRPPEDFRLDDEGGILCLTCHTGHGEFLAPVPAFAGQRPAAPGPSGEAGARYRTYFARRSDPREGFAPLCRGCHPFL